MPINTIIQRHVPGRGMVQIGKLFKGAARSADDIERKRPGKDLNYFRVEFNPGFTDSAYREVFAGLYGKESAVLDGAFLIAPTPDEALGAWYEEWGSGGLYHRCDGDVQASWFDRSKGRVIHDCPVACIRDAPQPCACKQIARINLWFPRYTHATGVLGYFTLQTHSMRDIQHLYSVLADVYQINGTLVHVPFVLSRELEEIEQPEIDKQTKRPTGNRIHVKKSLIRFRPMEEFVQRAALGHGAQAALDAPQPQQRALPAPEGERWNQQQALNWVNKMIDSTGLGVAELQTALGVATFGEWAGDAVAATYRVNAWITQQQEQQG